MKTWISREKKKVPHFSENHLAVFCLVNKVEQRFVGIKHLEDGGDKGGLLRIPFICLQKVMVTLKHWEAFCRLYPGKELDTGAAKEH